MIKVCEREQFLHELSKVRSLVKDTTIKNVSSGWIRLNGKENLVKNHHYLKWCYMVVVLTTYWYKQNTIYFINDDRIGSFWLDLAKSPHQISHYLKYVLNKFVNSFYWWCLKKIQQMCQVVKGCSQACAWSRSRHTSSESPVSFLAQICTSCIPQGDSSGRPGTGSLTDWSRTSRHLPSTQHLEKEDKWGSTINLDLKYPVQQSTNCM